MREILFRGKRKDNGEWVEGHYLTNKVVHGRPLEIETIENIYDVKHYIHKAGLDYEIIAETIGQFTGLTNKHGKQIFEGDIIDAGDRIAYVLWHKDCGSWDCRFIKHKESELKSNGITNAEWKHRATIIGNIHDNPELLEDTK